jgi:nicotinamide riboside kinase
MYRIITGACEKGTRYFVENNNIDKEEYKISEIIKLTKGQYNSEKFAEFFKNKK